MVYLPTSVFSLCFSSCRYFGLDWVEALQVSLLMGVTEDSPDPQEQRHKTRVLFNRHFEWLPTCVWSSSPDLCFPSWLLVALDSACGNLLFSFNLVNKVTLATLLITRTCATEAFWLSSRYASRWTLTMKMLLQRMVQSANHWAGCRIPLMVVLNFYGPTGKQILLNHGKESTLGLFWSQFPICLQTMTSLK